MEPNMEPNQEVTTEPTVEPAEQNVEPTAEPVAEPAVEPKKSGNAGRIVLIAALCVAIAALVVAIVGFTCGWFSGSADNDVEPSETTAESNDPAPSTDDPAPSTDGGDEEAFKATATGDGATAAAKGQYAVLNAVPGDADMSKAVATYEGGEMKNGELNIYFWMEYYNFMNSYGDYAQYFGLDPNGTLYSQASMSPIDEENEALGYMSWEQYFLTSAVENFKYYKGLELAAKKAGFEVPESYLEDLNQMIENLNTAAAEEGFENPEAYLQKSFGTGVTVDDYKAYYTTLITSYAYYEEVLHPQCAVSDEEAEEYFNEHIDDFEAQGINKTRVNDINVRHILITPEQDVDEDGDGTMDSSSEEALEAARVKAWDVYNEWYEDPTESNFGEMAKKYTADGNGEQGGLYENVYYGQMVSEFNDWCFSKKRAYGDVDVIKTDFGYHVMFFCGECDTMTWREAARDEAASEALQELSTSEAAKYPITVDFNNAAICDVVSFNVSKQGAE